MKTCKKEGCSYPVFGKKFCRNHQYLREDYKPYKYKKKPTGEKDIFLEIWEERERVSFVTGLELTQYEETDLFPNLFAHVLSKKQYPKFRLNKKNIVLLSPDEHWLYDQGTMADRQVYAQTCACDWTKLLALQIELKLEYEETYRNR